MSSILADCSKYRLSSLCSSNLVIDMVSALLLGLSTHRHPFNCQGVSNLNLLGVPDQFFSKTLSHMRATFMMSISEFFDDFSHSCSPTMGLPMKIWHQCMVSKYMKVNRACSPATMMKFLLPVICSTDEAVSEKAAIDQVGGGGAFTLRAWSYQRTMRS